MGRAEEQEHDLLDVAAFESCLCHRFARMELTCARFSCLLAFMSAISRIRLCIVVLAFCASFWRIASAEEGRPADPADSAKIQATGMTHMVLQEGVYACAERVNQVSTFLGALSSSGSVAMVAADKPNSRLFPLAMEVPTETGSAFVSASFAPNQANGCGASYDAVVYWPQSCLIIAGSRFGAFKSRRLLGKNIMMLDGGVSTKVFLMPADTGCISIKQEVVM